MHLISSHHIIIIIIIIINIGALFWSLLVICKEDGPNDNQNKRGGAARIVANDHLDDPASYVPLILVIVGHLQRGQSQRRLFGPKKAKYGRLISVPRWSKGSKMAQNGEPNCYSLWKPKLDQVYCAWLIKWWIISGTWWYWVSIWRYWLVLGQYKLVLLDIRWYMVSKGLVCLYILEKVEIWSGDTDAWHTHSQRENRATQLVSSIKHKLSHAESLILLLHSDSGWKSNLAVSWSIQFLAEKIFCTLSVRKVFIFSEKLMALVVPGDYNAADFRGICKTCKLWLINSQILKTSPSSQKHFSFPIWH